MKAELDKIRGAGEPVTAEELAALHSPPDHEDATPLWLEAIGMLKGPAFVRAGKSIPLFDVVPMPEAVGDPWPELE